MGPIIIINQGQDGLCQALSQQLDHCKVLEEFPDSIDNLATLCWLPADHSRVDLSVEQLVHLLDQSPVTPAKIVMKSIVGTADDATDEQVKRWYGEKAQTLVLDHLYAIKMIDELEYPYTIVRTLPLTEHQINRSIIPEGQPFSGDQSNLDAVSRVIFQAIVTDDYRNQSIGI
ncbi:saccharopine dehydrogenase related protein [uncultured Limosilactobacillus sp.]|uniref:saccharopine dehydrogenase related protein n=1 Tax=uncultured Limosilactobacillus sp. TaxID=2837629 RepID=UPI0025E9B1E0|nr:saccharopine dehydrogenase related protein [uncultured Limosilactobacillus sp.]